jgi:hypothetical protein
MTKENLKIGGIYNTVWDKRPYRVIGLDNVEVFYDCLWSHDNAWTFSGNFKRKCYFYRTSATLFNEKSEIIDYLPLTEEEHIFFRPDLPMRIGRTEEINWNDFTTNNYDDFNEKINEIDYNLQGQKLLTDKIVLLPFGNKGGLKRGIIIEADNSTFFECSELIWKAKELQEAVCSQISNGVGLYRIGFEKHLPSYYIGEYIDKAGLLRN